MSMACMWFDEDEVIELDEAVEFAIDNAELTEKKQGILGSQNSLTRIPYLANYFILGHYIRLAFLAKVSNEPAPP